MNSNTEKHDAFKRYNIKECYSAPHPTMATVYLATSLIWLDETFFIKDGIYSVKDLLLSIGEYLVILFGVYFLSYFIWAITATIFCKLEARETFAKIVFHLFIPILTVILGFLIQSIRF